MKELPQEKGAGGPYSRLSIPVKKLADILSLAWSHGSLLLDLAWVLGDTVSANSQKNLSSLLVFCLSFKTAQHLGALVYYNVFDILLRKKIIDYDSVHKGRIKGYLSTKFLLLVDDQKDHQKGITVSLFHCVCVFTCSSFICPASDSTISVFL